MYRACYFYIGRSIIFKEKTMTEDNGKRGGRASLAILLNILLAIALVILYVLYFGQDEKEKPQQKSNQNASIGAPSGEGVKVAFVNTDVLYNRYELVRQLAGEFEKEQKKRDADLKKRTSEYEQEAAYFQESINNESLSEQSAQRIYEQLMVKQQEIYDLQQKYSNELAQQEYEMNKVLLDSVKNYLHRINIENKYDYILNNSVGGPILLARDTFDITEAVLRGLNKEYSDLYQPDEK